MNHNCLLELPSCHICLVYKLRTSRLMSYQYLGHICITLLNTAKERFPLIWPFNLFPAFKQTFILIRSISHSVTPLPCVFLNWDPEGIVGNISSELSLSSSCSWSAPWLPSRRPLLKAGFCNLSSLNVLSRTVPCCGVCLCIVGWLVFTRWMSVVPPQFWQTKSWDITKRPWGVESPVVENCFKSVSPSWGCVSGQQEAVWKPLALGPSPRGADNQHVQVCVCETWLCVLLLVFLLCPCRC